MKTLIVLVVLVFACMADAKQKQNPPLACNVGVLTADQRAALVNAVHQLIDAKPSTTELPNGYQMTFDHAGDLFQTATTWIEFERLCCPFFEFAIELSKGNGPMTIRLTGPTGVKAFIDDDLPGIKQLTH